MFDELLTHADVAGNLSVVSAGFVDIKGMTDSYGGVHPNTICYGYSHSLLKHSRLEDTDIVIDTLNRRGV